MNSDEEQFIKLTADSTFKSFFKGKFRWFYRDIIQDYTGIDINDYDLYDNELNSGKKKNKGDIRYDILLMKKDNTEFLNLEINQYDCLNRNEMYLHTLNSWLYKKYQKKKEDNKKKEDKENIIMPLLKQININVFDTSDEISSHIALRNRNGKIMIENFQIFDLNLYIGDNLMYNKDKRLELLVCESFEEMEEVIGGEEKYMPILEELRRLGSDDDFLSVYNREADLAFMMDEVEGHAEERGKVHGIKIGEERGVKIGEAKNQEKTARNMLKKNYNISDISDITGLSETAISALM